MNIEVTFTTENDPNTQTPGDNKRIPSRNYGYNGKKRQSTE